jgi:hypothetical protein
MYLFAPFGNKSNLKRQITYKLDLACFKIRIISSWGKSPDKRLQVPVVILIESNNIDISASQ